tara:strand:+ start:66 stop:482 length:417 start_codon:yes stop_codon:yes gene_type:complete
MKVTGLNGREYNLDLKKYSKQRENCSFYHKIARGLLKEIFNGYNVYEEVKLPGSVKPSKKSVLYLDFYIPSAIMGVEVHGQQHFKYIPYFHKSRAGFAMAKKRDLDKKEWCLLNGIQMVELRWDDSPEYWREQIERSR